MATPNAYLAAMRAARVRGYSIDRVTARAIADAMEEYAKELAKRLASLPEGAEELAARRSLEIVRQAAAQLEARIVTAVQQGVDVTFDDTLAVWSEAQAKVARESGTIPNATLGAIRTAELTQAQTFASARLSYSWRSLVRSSVVNAAEETATIVHNALLRGMSPDELGRLLMPFVRGRERFVAELPETQDPSAVDAYSMQHNANRIAFTETHNARREAEAQHFERDPYIACGQWQLSPNRGTQRQPDVCDALAKLDWYGLGAGVFFLSRVPPTPHPWDRCELLPLTWTDVLRAKMARASGRLVLNPATAPIPGADTLTPRAVERIRIQLVDLLDTRPVETKRERPA